MRRNGRLVLVGDLIDVVASDALLEESSDPVRGGNPAGADRGLEGPAASSSTVAPVGDISLREAMRRERWAKATSAELALGVQAKQLAEVRTVEREVFTLSRQAMQRLRMIGSKLRMALAAETDPRRCEALVDEEVRQVAEDMQAAARALLRSDSANEAEAA